MERGRERGKEIKGLWNVSEIEFDEKVDGLMINSVVFFIIPHTISVIKPPRHICLKTGTYKNKRKRMRMKKVPVLTYCEQHVRHHIARPYPDIYCGRYLAVGTLDQILGNACQKFTGK